MIVPRMAELASSMTLSVTMSAMPALMASMPASIIGCLSVGLGKFCG